MNNTALLEIMAARAAAGNPAMADMLARMRSAPGGDPSRALPELMAQLGETNPTAAVLARHLAEAQAASSAKAQVIDVKGEPDDADSAGARSDVPAEAVAELSRCAQSMFSELKILRERSDLLASALGACCLCWGHDPECRICRGRGRPGFSRPDESLFEEFVIPAIQMMRAQRSRQSGPSPASQP